MSSNKNKSQQSASVVLKKFSWCSSVRLLGRPQKQSPAPSPFGNPHDPNQLMKTKGNDPFALSKMTADGITKQSAMSAASGSQLDRRVRHFLSDITVEPILFLYMLSTFSQYASFHDLVYSRSCLQSYPSSVCDHLDEAEYKEEAETIQKASSLLILLSTTSLVLPSIFIAVYLGSWSDRFGRKGPLLFPPLGGVLACIVLIVVAFHPQIPIIWICLSSFLSGLFGGFVSCIMSCMSYVSAISSEGNRTVRISRLEAMIFLGGTVGPFISGTVLQYIGHGYSFVLMLSCYLTALLYALCVKEVKDNEHGGAVPEQQQQQQEQQQQRPSSVASALSSSMKSSTLDSREVASLDLEVVESLLSRNIPDVARYATEAVYIETGEYNSQHYESPSFDTPPPYQPLSIISCTSNSSSHFEDGNSSAASEDEQRNILKRNSPELEGRGAGGSCCSRYFGSQHLFAAILTVGKRREGGRRFYLILTLVAGYIGMMITAGELDVAYLFAKGEPLSWDHKYFSYYFGLKYGVGTLVLLLVMPIFQHFQVRDSSICVLGLCSRIAGLVLYALSPNTVIAFLVPIAAMFSSFSIPATRSLLSKLVSPDEQGKIFAFVAIMEDICVLTASFVFNSLYPLTRPILNGFIFLLAAIFLLIPILIMWFIGRQLSRLELACNSKETEAAEIDSHVPDLEHGKC